VKDPPSGHPKNGGDKGDSKQDDQDPANHHCFVGQRAQRYQQQSRQGVGVENIQWHKKQLFEDAERQKDHQPPGVDGLPVHGRGLEALDLQRKTDPKK